MNFYGADPGGKKCFGVARLLPDGQFATWLCSSVDEATTHTEEPAGFGIDCPLWWSSGEGGGRRVDRDLRTKYRISSGTIQSVNSLRGAALIQGVVLAYKLRIRFPNLMITETHPKALLKALKIARKPWADIAHRFALVGDEPDSEHEVDALLGAVVVREALCRRWTVDLAKWRDETELNQDSSWIGPVNYWWPEVIDTSRRT